MDYFLLAKLSPVWFLIVNSNYYNSNKQLDKY